MILGIILGICILILVCCIKLLIWIKKKEIEADILANKLKEYIEEDEENEE